VTLHAVGGSVDNDTDALTSLLRDLLSDGGCALIVRNTVARVLQTATALEQAFPGEVTVAHSRFITADRLHKDSELLDRFGPPARARHRPVRHIVVASQVVEQSLDVDFDLLVTDLAPVDLVLQRMGRLHRHARGHGQAERPSRLRTARAYIAGVDFTRDPPELETASSRHVYGTYPMLRSAAVLMPRIGSTVTLPDDIAPLVRAAYGDEDIEPPSWRTAVDDAHARWIDSIEHRAAKARDYQIGEPQRPGMAILGWVSGSVGETDDDAQGQGQVRDGAPTLEAILVQQSDSGDWHTPDWLPEEQASLVIPHDATPSNDLASVLLTCAVRLPLEFSNARAEEALWAQTPEPWEHSPLIYRLPVVVVDDQGMGQIAGRPIRYTPDRGLEVLNS
jgi:CRISPR-associated endonuclease/helicase Cas3